MARSSATAFVALTRRSPLSRRPPPRSRKIHGDLGERQSLSALRRVTSPVGESRGCVARARAASLWTSRRTSAVQCSISSCQALKSRILARRARSQRKAATADSNSVEVLTPRFMMRPQVRELPPAGGGWARLEADRVTAPRALESLDCVVRDAPRCPRCPAWPLGPVPFRMRAVATLALLSRAHRSLATNRVQTAKVTRAECLDAR